MRVSLLLQREAFGEILQRTLRRYWRARHGVDFTVEWNRPRGQELAQVWHGNIYLNFFACAGTPARYFESVRRDFGRSVSPWMRLLQRTYVSVGTSTWGAPRLAQTRFYVRPACPDGGHCLIMGGNHRLRILEPEQARYVVVLKDGTAPWHITNEIKFRTNRPLAFVPGLLEVAPDQSWFAEKFVAATGATRLPPARAAGVVAEATRLLAEQVVAPTMEAARVADIAAELRGAIEAGGRRDLRLQAALGGEIRATADRLAQLTASGSLQTGVAWTHGDFQPSNMMADDRQVWIIDWESVSRRFCAYDAMTVGLGGRHGAGLARGVAAVLHEARHPAHQLLARWPAVEWQPLTWRPLLALYLLEEMVFRLKDVTEAGLRDPIPNMRDFLEEIKKAAACLAP